MWRTTRPLCFIRKILRVSQPPMSGYELVELPNETVLREFMQHHRTKGVLVILHSGLSTLSDGGAASNASTGMNRHQDGLIKCKANSFSRNDDVLRTGQQRAGAAAAASLSRSNNSASITTSHLSPKPSSKSSSSISADPVMRSFISSINRVNLGNPEDVKLALVPASSAPQLVDTYKVIGLPTTLLFINNECLYRCVGARPRELSIKSLFMLRNHGKNVFARE